MRVGDRVILSDEVTWRPRNPDRIGTLVRIAMWDGHHMTVRVQWDGLKTIHTYAACFIKPCIRDLSEDNHGS